MKAFQIMQITRYISKCLLSVVLLFQDGSNYMALLLEVHRNNFVRGVMLHIHYRQELTGDVHSNLYLPADLGRICHFIVFAMVSQTIFCTKWWPSCIVRAFLISNNVLADLIVLTYFENIYSEVNIVNLWQLLFCHLPRSTFWKWPLWGPVSLNLRCWYPNLL